MPLVEDTTDVTSDVSYREKESDMNETLQEFVDSRGVEMRVDRQNGVIRGAKILGVHSRNGRTYLPETLAEAARLYEDRWRRPSRI